MNKKVQTFHNNKHIDYRLRVCYAKICFYVAERSEQKPELTTKLGTTRETLQEYRL